MSDEPIVNIDAAREVPGGERVHSRSSIEFPYGDLESAIGVAKTLHEHVGLSPCAPEQLAAFLNLAPNSGGFRARVAPARIFGLVETERGKIQLTELGRQVVDPTTEKTARVSAFLAVPLYKALYDRYKSAMLPPAVALEREIEGLGVAPKQKDKARQIFERSADQAGFRAHGKNRLVMPITAQSEAAPAPSALGAPADAPESSQAKAFGSGGSGSYHPFIEGLLRTLPPPDTEWKASDRIKWLQTAERIFSLIYKGDGSTEIRIVSNAQPPMG